MFVEHEFLRVKHRLNGFCDDNNTLIIVDIVYGLFMNANDWLLTNLVWCMQQWTMPYAVTAIECKNCALQTYLILKISKNNEISAKPIYNPPTLTINQHLKLLMLIVWTILIVRNKHQTQNIHAHLNVWKIIPFDYIRSFGLVEES